MQLKFGEKNVGTADRILRIVLGIILIALFVLDSIAAPWSYLLAIIGIIAVLTGIFSTCGLYSLLGIDTRGKAA